VGLSQLLCVSWLLAQNVVSLEAGLSSLTRLWSGHLVMHFRGHLFFIQSNLWLRGLRCAPQITGFTVTGYPPLLLSDKISTSQLLHLLTLWLLAPESERVFHHALTSPARPSITEGNHELSLSSTPSGSCFKTAIWRHSKPSHPSAGTA